MATTLEFSRGCSHLFFRLGAGVDSDGHIDDVASALIALKRKNKRRTATLSATVPLL